VAPLDLEDAGDVGKLNALIVGAFGAIAAVRSYPGWQIEPVDALQISRPLNDILKQYPALAEKVLASTAPIALITSVVWLVGPRVVADRVYHAEMLRQAAAAARAQAQQPPPPPTTYAAGAQTVPPAPAPSNGHAPPSGFPKDLNLAAEMWSVDASGRVADGLPVL